MWEKEEVRWDGTSGRVQRNRGRKQRGKGRVRGCVGSSLQKGGYRLRGIRGLLQLKVAFAGFAWGRRNTAGNSVVIVM